MLGKLKNQVTAKKYNIVVCAILFVVYLIQTIVMCRLKADEMQTAKKMFIVMHAAGWIFTSFLIMWGKIWRKYPMWKYVACASLLVGAVVGNIYLDMTANYQMTASAGRGVVLSVMAAAVWVCLFPGKMLGDILKFEKHRDYILASLAFVIMEIGIDKVLAIVDISWLYVFMKDAGQVILALVWLRYSAFLNKKQCRGRELVILLFVAVITCFMFNVCVGGYAILKIWWHIPVFLLCAAFYYITAGRLRYILYAAEGILMVFAIINGYVIKFRNTPIMPDDFYAAATAANVAGNYSYVPGTNIIVTAALGVIAILCIRQLELKRDGWKRSCIYCAGAVAAFCVSLSGFWYENVSTNVFNPLLTARYEGYLRAFASDAGTGGIEEPQGYNTGELKELAEEVGVQETTGPAQQPDIVVIMDEAFSDLGIVGDFETSEDYMPFIHSLEGEHVSKGWMAARRGSGTVYTESEFLFSTSASNYFGTIPYVRSIKSDIPSLVSVLKEQGYHTIGFHPEKGSNYCRSTVWSCMGFDDIMFKDTMTEQIKVSNEYCSDESDFQQLMSLYEKNKDKEHLFLFNVTMQNHSPYGENADKIEITSFEAEDDVENYLAYIRETDRAFEQLIRYFEESEKPVIVLMFGDHQPGIAETFYESVYGKSLSQLTDEESLQSIMVPYIMWTNYDADIEDIGTVSPNYLAPWLLETAGLDMNRFERKVWDMRDEYPVISTNLYKDKSGELHPYGDDASLPEWLQQYKMLTYNYIFDTGNRVEAWFE